MNRGARPIRAEESRRSGLRGDGVGSARRWDRWQRLCGWSALIAAASWAVKFLAWALLAAQYTDGLVSNAAAEHAGPAVLVVLVTFLLPTAGSVLGLVAGSGLVVPWVRVRPWFVGVPVAVLSALVVTTVISTLTNASTALLSGSNSQALRIEGSDLTTAVLLTILGLVLLMWPGGGTVGAGEPGRSPGRERPDPAG